MAASNKHSRKETSEESAGAVEDGRSSEDSERLHVVGLGASAGGLKALRSFFSKVPGDTGMAFVVVVHLSPDYESKLAELLQMEAAIRIQEVTEAVRMQPDHAYVIPPGKNIQITNGELSLTEFDEPRWQRAPIDHFFRSLAYAHPDGIGVIFSGGGSDGTVGMKAIKEQGGILFAQAPEEADHDSMPHSAIATGLVDFVLPVEDMVRKILDLKDKAHLYVLPKTPDGLPDADETALHEVLSELRAQLDHDFSGYKRSTVLRRIERRMRVHQVRSLSEYLGFLRSNGAESEVLFKDLLITVTNFFRDPESWEALEEEVIPRLFENKGPDDEVRVWVAGCATGEEAYSMGIALLEHTDTMERSPRLQVFASDLDEDALRVAREGAYPAAIEADVSEHRLKRHFARRGEHYWVKNGLRDIILFANHDLLRDPPFHRQDLISCRNLLIYLQRDLQRKVFDVFHYSLNADGYLFLGKSEAAENTTNLFSPIIKKYRLYQRREISGKNRVLPDMPLKITRRRPVDAIETARHEQAGRSVAELHRMHLEKHAPPSVLVDETYAILHLSETAGRFLHYPGGTPTHSILQTVLDELRLDLGTALHTAFDEGEPVSAGPVEVTIEGVPCLVHIIVRPTEDDEQQRALVLFAETKLNNGGHDGGARPTKAGVLRLQKELNKTKERLLRALEEHETSEEELKAANEELQSINEEYRSTLEELETSKEELQSVNEELQTVNTELQTNVEELSQANNDLNNLMGSTDVATIFLNRQLEIERYTQQVSRHFSIRETDRGRPIAHLAHQFEGYDSLLSDARQVLETLVPVEHELRDKRGNWYLARILPYRTEDNRIEGVVITFVDISRLKKAEEKRRQIEERHRLLLERVQEYAIFTINEDGTIASWNPGAERIFGYAEAEVLGRHVRVIFVAEDRETDAAEEEMEVATREGQATDERWHLRKDGSRFWGSGVLTALHDEDGSLRGYAKVLRDNTQRREATEALRKSRRELQELNETLEQRVAERTAELKHKSDQVRQLASELIISEQDERHRIAQILHDDLQQMLDGIQMRVTTLIRSLDALDEADLKKGLEETRHYLEDAVQKTRNLAIGLSLPVLENEGLSDAVRWLATQMKELHGLQVEVQAEESFFTRSHEMQVFIFQLMRELLFNVVKHAGTDRASVDLRRTDDRLCIDVRDEGRGFDADVVLERGDHTGFGLRSIRERLDLFDGTFDVESAPGVGTHIAITVPVEGRKRNQK